MCLRASAVVAASCASSGSRPALSQFGVQPGPPPSKGVLLGNSLYRESRNGISLPLHHRPPLLQPSDDPAVEYFLEPRMLEARDHEGFWLRLVDVAAALKGRGWTTDGEISITVRADRLAPWNAGSYRVNVSSGTADVTPCPTTTDVEISVKALASLYTGRRSARELSAWGLLTGDADAVRRADNLFATRHAPHFPDHF